MNQETFDLDAFDAETDRMEELVRERRKFVGETRKHLTNVKDKDLPNWQRRRAAQSESADSCT